MAALGKIRKRGVALVIIIGLGLSNQEPAASAGRRGVR